MRVFYHKFASLPLLYYIIDLSRSGGDTIVSRRIEMTVINHANILREQHEYDGASGAQIEGS